MCTIVNLVVYTTSMCIGWYLYLVVFSWTSHPNRCVSGILKLLQIQKRGFSLLGFSPVYRYGEQVHHACIARHVIYWEPDVAKLLAEKERERSDFQFFWEFAKLTWEATYPPLSAGLWRRGLNMLRLWSLRLPSCEYRSWYKQARSSKLRPTHPVTQRGEV